jgi:hypothetical protein
MASRGRVDSGTGRHLLKYEVSEYRAVDIVDLCIDFGTSRAGHLEVSPGGGKFRPCDFLTRKQVAKRVEFGRPTRIGGSCCSHCGFLNRINTRRRYFFIITAR